MGFDTIKFMQHRAYLPVILRNEETCSEYIRNGGFESGVPPWVFGGTTVLTPLRAHSGIYSAWLGGRNNTYDWMYQTVTIPANSSATLSYWWYMHTDEITHPWDFLYVKIRGPYYTRLVEIIHDGSTPDRWLQSTFDVSEFAGQTVDVLFEADTDGLYITSFYIDDVSLWVCPQAACEQAPTPTPTGTPLWPTPTLVSPLPTPTDTPHPSADTWTFSGEASGPESGQPVPCTNTTLYYSSGRNDWQVVDRAITGGDGQFTLQYAGPLGPGWFMLLVRYPPGYAPVWPQPGPHFTVVHHQAPISIGAIPAGAYGGIAL